MAFRKPDTASSSVTLIKKRQKLSLSSTDRDALKNVSVTKQSKKKRHYDDDDPEHEHEHPEALAQEGRDTNMSSSIKLDQLGFEILDTIFSFFSTPGLGGVGSDGGGYSHYENQLNLLNFCQVSRGFYDVARLHLSRFIPIASTFKARQVLSLCSASSTSSNPNDTFGSRVHSLLLHWPDQGKYSTRRSSVITPLEFLNLLSSFPSLRSLEVVHLPYTSFSTLEHATLASSGALDNLRSLNLNGSPYNLRNEEFSIVVQLMGLCGRLEELELTNVPLNASVGIVDLPPPGCRLTSLSIKISSARRLDPAVLEWMLQSTIKAGSCSSLTVWLSKKCTDVYNEHNNAQVKEDSGFKDLQCPLSKLSPSLRHLSMLGLRTGQANEIFSKTSGKLRRLTVLDTFGFGGGDLLAHLPGNTGLRELEMLDNPGVAFGKVLPVDEVPTRRTPAAGNARASTSTSAGSASGTTGPSANVSNSTPSISTTTSNGTTSTASTASTTATATDDQPSTHTTTQYIEIPISSHSFISELGPGNKLQHLKVVRIPENARFGKRGRWVNKELIKACRRAGVRIEEVPSSV